MSRKIPRQGRGAPRNENAAVTPINPNPEPAARIPGPAIPRSNVTGVEWPAMPGPEQAVLLALQHQFQESESLPPATLESRQLEALGSVLRHASSTVPFYRDRAIYAEVASEELTSDTWRRLPILSRADVLEADRNLGSTAAPADHAPLYETFTSGRTGPPVRVIGTKVTAALWQAITLRDLAWHPRDLKGKLAAIRSEGAEQLPAEGVELEGWGAPTQTVFDTGPCVLLGAHHDAAVQADWLVRQQPDYLLSSPSNLLSLAEHFSSNGAGLLGLRGVTSYGAALSAETRAACRDAWGTEIVDMYSTGEVGYVALQCPESERYHVQAESVYVEVLDDEGQPCAPGTVGRVVVTPMHNYAMPFLRYDLGDYAEVGDQCSCGRTLPVLNRILGPKA